SQVCSETEPTAVEISFATGPIHRARCSRSCRSTNGKVRKNPDLRARGCARVDTAEELAGPTAEPDAPEKPERSTGRRCECVARCSRSFIGSRALRVQRESSDDHREKQAPRAHDARRSATSTPKNQGISRCVALREDDTCLPLAPKARLRRCEIASA